MKVPNGKKSVAALLSAVLALGGMVTVLLVGCNRDHNAAAEAKQEQLYTCGMHPQVIQNKPGNCPICGMKLTPIRKQAGAGGSSAAPATAERKVKFYKSTMMPGEVRQTPGKDSMGMEMVAVYEGDTAATSQGQSIAIDPVTTQTMGIRKATVTRGPVRRVVRTVGVIDFDETALAEVSTKFRGWIEKLYVDATGKQMHRGDPLFEIYSPELYLAQTEYLLTLDSTNATADITADLRKNAAITKLRYWDISEDQIAELKRSGMPKKTLRMNAPRDGIVVEKMVTEGQMVEPGMKLYRLADLATVWVQAQVYEQDLAFINLGQEATVSLASQPEPKFRGRVTYIYPTVDEKTRTARVRMEFHNPGYFLKPGMYATVEMSSELSPSALLVPDMAVLRSGEKNTVFVALDEGRFEPRIVTLGPGADGNMYEVLSGLKEGDRVVTSGQFMLDSESQLREAIQKMLKPSDRESALASSTQHAPAGPEATTSNTPASDVKYICPMPEHVSLEYDHAGKCPLCGMTLVPVTAEVMARIQPGGKLEYYTCPMPEHSDVHEQKPGKCPRCGMTLIPVMTRPRPAEMPRSDGSASGAVQLPERLYTCPMAEHAHVVLDKPGVCPECAMKLVETTKVNHGHAAEDNWRRQHPPLERPTPDHQH